MTKVKQPPLANAELAVMNLLWQAKSTAADFSKGILK